MRTIHWLFIVSALLFISGIALVVAAARTAVRQPGTAVEAPAAMTPVASVKQIMRGIVAPSATVVFESVSTTVSAAGIDEKQPRTDEEWAEVGSSAAALVEAGNLLTIGTRAVDRADWVTMSRAMIDAGTAALAAAEAKSAEGILAAGEHINTSCDNCHERYWRQ